MAEPDCPKCPFSPMEVREPAAGVRIDECPKCGGHWYDFDELVKLSADPGKLQQAIARGPLRPRAGAAKCPRCLKDMVNGGLVNELLRVDQCPGHGFWLDAGESRLLQKLLA